jgi:Coenzyme PQQ synthesis protein D (PqqD)
MPRRPPADAAIQISKDVVFRDLEGEMVLLNLATGVYFGLDPVGTRIWELLASGRSSDEIVGALTAEYDVDAETCRADLARFLGTLRDNELVQPDDGR